MAVAKTFMAMPIAFIALLWTVGSFDSQLFGEAISYSSFLLVYAQLGLLVELIAEVLVSSASSLLISVLSRALMSFAPLFLALDLWRVDSFSLDVKFLSLAFDVCLAFAPFILRWLIKVAFDIAIAIAIDRLWSTSCTLYDHISHISPLFSPSRIRNHSWWSIVAFGKVQSCSTIESTWTLAQLILIDLVFELCARRFVRT